MKENVEYRIGDVVRVWLRPAFSKPVAEGIIMDIGLDGTVVLKCGPNSDDWFKTTLSSLEKSNSENMVDKYGPNPCDWPDDYDV